MPNRPNVILLMADQWRGDCLGCLGHPDVKTPFLDSLAARGTLFTRAYSSTPTCIAARAALFTGLKPEHHGRVGYRDGIRWDYPVTLAGEFTRAGYQTECVGKMHVHPPRASMGFQHVLLHDGYLHYYRRADTPYIWQQHTADDYYYEMAGKGHRDPTDTGLECNSHPVRPWIYDEESHPTNWVARNAVDFLRRRDRDKPFFLMASFVRPHPPYDAPAYYLDRYLSGPLTLPKAGAWAPPYEAETANSVSGISDPVLMREALAGYYACMTHIDHQISRILQAVEAEGLFENTIIAFVSDHGEMMGDHHYMRKSLPYEGSARVPFILAGPGIPKGRNEKAVEMMDVMPTLLTAAGLSVPDCADGEDAFADTGRELIFGEHCYGRLSNHYIVSARDKYIWFSQTGEEQYFDLSADPGELRNAAGDAAYAQRVAYLRAEMVRHLTGRAEGYTDGERLIPGKPPCDLIQST